MSQHEERWIAEARMQREDRVKMLERNAKQMAEKEQRLRELGKNYVFPRKEDTVAVATTEQAQHGTTQMPGKLAKS